jgi:hypothetical protein
MEGTAMTRWLNVEMAADEHGNSYVRVLRNPDTGALATVEAFDPNPPGPAAVTPRSRTEGPGHSIQVPRAAP